MLTHRRAVLTLSVAATAVLLPAARAGAVAVAPAAPSPVLSVRILADLNGDGVPEVLIRRSAREELRDGRSGGVIKQLPANAIVANAVVGTGRKAGLIVTSGAFQAGSNLTLAAYDGKGHTQWKHPLAGLPVRAGDHDDDGLTEVREGAFDGDLTTDLLVVQHTTSELRVSVADAATGAMHAITDLRPGSQAFVTPLSAKRDGVIVTTAPTDTTPGTLRAFDGHGTSLWQSTVGIASTAVDVEPFDTGHLLVSEFLIAQPGRAAGAYTRLVDSRTGHVSWTRPGLTGGGVEGGGGRGPIAIVARQDGSTITVGAFERSGHQRWSRKATTSFGTQGLPLAYTVGSIGGNAVPDVIVYLSALSGSSATVTLVLDGASGKPITPATPIGVYPDLTPGVVTAASLPPGGQVAGLTAATGDDGRTTVSRHDYRASQDRWDTVIGGPGRIALSVFGKRGPKGCGSVGVLLGGSRTIASVTILGLTNGKVRWSLDATTGAFSLGPESADAC